MKILKALQRRQAESAGGPAGTAPGVQTFGGPVYPVALPPFADSVRIGSPGSAFNGQPFAADGMALPVDGSGISAGATLNAADSTRPTSAAPPDFVQWRVEAGRVESHLVAITQPNSVHCEEYRSLRTQILHRSEKTGLKSVVVASVNAGEGKSVTALNLSWMLAQSDGLRCLVIDSDLRKPRLTSYLGIETDGGLSDVLTGRSKLRDSIIRLEPSGLHLLPGGYSRSDVAELISGFRFRDVLREACEMFDFVIIDAPPLGIFTDANLLINQADAALLVIRAGMTKYSAVDRILETLPKDRMLGVVLNEGETVSENPARYGY
jgi:capsular exopolysaccharide synthesis family protein